MSKHKTHILLLPYIHYIPHIYFMNALGNVFITRFSQLMMSHASLMSVTSSAQGENIIISFVLFKMDLTEEFVM